MVDGTIDDRSRHCIGVLVPLDGQRDVFSASHVTVHALSIPKWANRGTGGGGATPAVTWSLSNRHQFLLWASQVQ